VGHADDTVSRRALLLIDFQYDFLADNGRMPVDRSQVQPVLTATRSAIDKAQGAGDLIVRIGNEFKPGDFVGNTFRHRAAIAGSSGACWDPRVDAGDSVYVAKWRGNAFCNPELSRLMSDHLIEEVCLTGLFARGCVTATAKGASARGLQVHLLVDAIACKSDASRSAALARLGRRGMELVAGGSAD
jgi:nicotinamidase-related amidase